MNQLKHYNILIYGVKIYLFLILFQWLFSDILKSNLNNILSIMSLLVPTIILFINNIKIYTSKIIIVVVFIFGILLLSIMIYSLNVPLKNTLVYSSYKYLEILLLFILLNQLKYEDFLKIILFLRNSFIIVMIPLFFLYIIDILNMFNFPNRFIVFNDYRFGGLIGEPRDCAVFSIMIFATILLIKREKFHNLEVLFFIIIIFSTFSNTIILFIPIILLLYLFIKLKFIYKILFIIFIPILIFIIFNIMPTEISLGRFLFDKNYILQLLNNFNDIEIDKVNAVNVRLFLFIKNLQNIPLFGYGFGSANEFLIIEGFEYGTGAIGFTTLIQDFGIVPFLLYFTYIIYKIKIYYKIDRKLYLFLVIVFSGFLFMNSPYSKLYLLFFLYFIFINKQIYYIQKILKKEYY